MRLSQHATRSQVLQVGERNGGLVCRLCDFCQGEPDPGESSIRHEGWCPVKVEAELAAAPEQTRSVPGSDRPNSEELMALTPEHRVTAVRHYLDAPRVWP